MSLYSLPCHTLEGTPFNLHALKGQVLLIVNIATHCRFTPQLAALEALYERYHDQGLTLLAFPCDQFAHQTPEEGRDIARACASYSIQFPLMEKVFVNGRNAHPLFAYLEREARGVLGTRAIKWNFTKFLISRDGQVLHRYSPTLRPERMRRDIERALDTPAR
ncbi:MULTISPECIES: glutathione peroxidase [unclassified Zymobacter]|uniref:glutathione peroxidase n=1 Tax=unclassified Zymobacter TaxID=3048685 RepID=UPI0039C45842